MATAQNLQDAFAGESQANRKYMAFAKKADKDGFPRIAKLFRAAAAAETIHAHNHLRVMGGIKDVAANLQAAIDGEGHEFKSMYPEFIAEAEKEGNKPALTTFKGAMATEKQHFDLYSKALESAKEGKDVALGKIVVCEICGCTLEGDAPDRCPICGAPKDKFFEVE